MSTQEDDSLEEQLDKLEEAAESGDQQHPIIRFLPIIVPVAALAILVPAGLLFFRVSSKPKVEIQTVILSPEGVIKIDPADPGGAEIPDQDKMVYDPMKQGPDDGADAQVLPPPETPMAPPKGVADLAAAIPPPPGAKEPILPPPPGAAGEAGTLNLPQIPVSDDGGSGVPPPPGGAEPAAAPPTPPPGGETAIVPPPAAPPKVPETALATKTPDAVAGAKVPKPVPVATAGGKTAVPSGTTTSTKVVSTTQTASLGQNYRVQIQSLKSQGQAEKAWVSWVKKHPDLFGDLSLTVQRAVIKDRGTYYRVQAGPFADHKKADDLCRMLKKRGQDCLVIRP